MQPQMTGSDRVTICPSSTCGRRMTGRERCRQWVDHTSPARSLNLLPQGRTHRAKGADSLTSGGFARERPATLRRAEANELRLIGRVGERDVKAFEDLYRAYYPRLARFLFNLLNRPQLVEEVLDDTLMTVWERAHTFQGASKLSTWIFTIAYRKALRARQSREEPLTDERMENEPSSDDTPEEEWRRQKVRELLVEALSELSPEHRAVVDLTYFHGMAYREIAAIMSCPVDTVKTRMFHARRNLKRHLRGELADWL